MNERIKELLKKAQKITAENYAPGGRDYEREIYSKFTELIVRECIAMADEFEIEVNRSGLVDRMKEHFGVEE